MIDSTESIDPNDLNNDFIGLNDPNNDPNYPNNDPNYPNNDPNYPNNDPIQTTISSDRRRPKQSIRSYYSNPTIFTTRLSFPSTEQRNLTLPSINQRKPTSPSTEPDNPHHSTIVSIDRTAKTPRFLRTINKNQPPHRSNERSHRQTATFMESQRRNVVDSLRANRHRRPKDNHGPRDKPELSFLFFSLLLLCSSLCILTFVYSFLSSSRVVYLSHFFIV